MYRIFKSVEGAWELEKQLKKLPKDFKLEEGYQLEKDNDNGSVTILESPDLETDNEDIA